MNLSKTAQYAIRVISYMILKEEPLYPASRLVSDLKIPDKYLRRILTTLTSTGLVESVKGKYGGFRLQKKQEDIRLYDIVASVESLEKYFGCVLGFGTCSDASPCSLHITWAPVRDEIRNFLQTTTIAEVIRDPQIMKF